MDSIGMVIIDEAGAVTMLDSLIVWRGDLPVILAGDPFQLPPPAMSATATYSKDNPVNAFIQQLKQPLITALIENNWPHSIVPEQMRIEPGLWDMVNQIIYRDRIPMNKNIKPSKIAHLFEERSTSLSERSQRIIVDDP
jgi:superfamily I DNA and/or RNA helicase